MPQIDGTTVALAAAICISCGIGFIWLMALLDRPRERVARTLMREAQNSTSFLFDGDHLVDSSASGSQLIGIDTPRGSDWTTLRDSMLPRFPDFPKTTAEVLQEGQCTLFPTTSTDPGRVQIETWNGFVRVSLTDLRATSGGTAGDLHRLAAAESELAVLRRAVDHAPYPVWETDPEGEVIWSNIAYDDLRREVTVGNPSKADLPLFAVNTSGERPAGHQRFSLATGRDDPILWFDVTSQEFGETRMHYATDINAVVQAEMAQRNFVQTLTKTFAQLSIGLAIFDRHRQLALFNPALIDLTDLPPDFLSARPNLLTFFDRLRDNQMMPEPKNYTSWRGQIADVVAAATDGRYSEIWTLHSGLTYRVSGRPHPDGAIAFLFEDISAEISLTRRFRAELELGQSVLDMMEEAVAVFSSVGVLTLSNNAYRDLWRVDPDSAFADTTIMDATRGWQDMCEASPIWSELRDFVVAFGDRAEWDATVRLVDGDDLHCRIVPLSGGATLVSFSVMAPVLPLRSAASGS